MGSKSQRPYHTPLGLLHANSKLIRHVSVGACVLCSCASALWLAWLRNHGEVQFVFSRGLSSPVAICISGASRGSLPAFAAALRKEMLGTASLDASFHLFGWLNDDAAELELERLFAAPEGFPVLTRRAALPLLPPALRRSEEDRILSDHGEHAQSGGAGSMRVNTLRMLLKLQGVEWLRAHVEQTRSLRFTLIVRIRPDLILLSPFPLPPPPAVAARVWLPWQCDGEGLAFDQLLASGPEAAVWLGSLYEPAKLRAALAQTGGSHYPERLVYVHLAEMPSQAAVVGDGSWALGWGSLRAALRDAHGGDRDPWAKLRQDFPRCNFPRVPIANWQYSQSEYHRLNNIWPIIK